MPKKISDIRRGEIVQALHDAVASDGISMPSYDLIARQGDMSRQLVRHYYRDAEQMAVDLCEHLAATSREQLERAALYAETGERLRLILDFHFDRLGGRGAGRPGDDVVHAALVALAGTSERVRDALRTRDEALIGTLADEIALAHDTLAPEATRALATHIVAQIRGYWLMRASLGIAVDDEAARTAVDALIAAYVSGAGDISDAAHAGTVSVAAP